MELRHLRYFVAVAEQLHFGRAATRLRISQPTLSQQIRQLESRLQITLFSRANQRIQLTEAGQLFLGDARAILELSHRAAEIARSANRKESGTLAIGLGPLMEFTAIPTVVRNFVDRYPNVRVEIRSLAMPLQIAALRDRRLDVGFLRAPVNESWLRREVVAAERFIVAVPERHRLLPAKTVRLTALADEAIVLFPRVIAPHLYDLTLTLCNDGGFVPHVRHEADHPLTVLALVAAGLGISLVPESVGAVGRPGIVFRPLQRAPRILRTAVAWRRDDRSRSTMVEPFLQIVRESLVTAGKPRPPRRVLRPL
jgi:DNA-binding transcriptional LysR family regulator